MTRRAASLTSSLMARKGTAGPSRLELQDEEHQEKPQNTHAHLVPVPSGPAAKKAPAKKKAAAPAESKRRFTLRLTEDQHIRMRLASVHLHMSAQQMVMTALDKYLSKTVPHIRGGDCACVSEDDCGSRSKKDPAKGKK